MDGIKVLDLAELVGLKQASIAHHFGVTRVQVHRWAHGQRPVPVHHRDELVRLLFNAVRTFLGPWHAAYLKAVAGIGSPQETSMPLSELKDFAHEERQQIAARFYEIFVAHMAERGEGPVANLAELITEVGAYDSMATELLHKPDHLYRLAELGRRLTANAELELPHSIAFSGNALSPA